MDPPTFEHIARGVYRVLDGSQLLACKLFDGPHAGDRARVEGAAYAALAARGAPVPRLLAVEEAHAAVVREWVAGPTLAQALRGDAPPPEWQAVAAAWERLLAALDDWTEALDSERVSRAYHLRQSEIAAVAESVIASAALQRRHPAWEEAGRDIRRLAKTISTAPMRTVPLDLNPGNLILGSDGITFVDLEAFGLDFGEWSLCKATMLPGDPSSGSAGQALAASHVGALHLSRHCDAASRPQVTCGYWRVRCCSRSPTPPDCGAPSPHTRHVRRSLASCVLGPPISLALRRLWSRLQYTALGIDL